MDEGEKRMKCFYICIVSSAGSNAECCFTIADMKKEREKGKKMNREKV